MAVNNNVFYQTGVIEKEKLTCSQPSGLSDADIEYKITAANFIIPEECYDLTVKGLQLSGITEETAKDSARKILVKKYALAMRQLVQIALLVMM